MRHPGGQQLLSYLEDGLSPEQCDRVEVHLRACPACRICVEQIAWAEEGLTTTLHAVGKQVPLAPGRSWQAVRRRRKGRSASSAVALFRPSLRYAATLAILAILVAGLAGLFHVLAITRTAPSEAVPTPHNTPSANPSAPPWLIPGYSPDHPEVPATILILGVDGEKAASSEVDMLMLLYVDPRAKRAFLLSIPRDLYVEVPGHGQARAGSVYGIGERDGATGGLALARETISITLGLPVQRAALVRFDGFVALIDAIGGVDVDVPHPIDDPTFPDGHGGYAPLLIPAGQHHFDGTFALRYARTRVTPTEGFDRTFRQQQIVRAAHERVTRLDLLPKLLPQTPTLWKAVAGSLETDLSLNEVVDLAFLASGLADDDIATATLEECCTIEHTTPDGKRVLLPRPEEIENLIEGLLEECE